MPSARASAAIVSMPSVEPELHRHRIARVRERVAQRHGAQELAVVVARAIDAAASSGIASAVSDTIVLAVTVSAIAVA